MSDQNKKVGSRAEVWQGTAAKTRGGLMKENLAMNAQGCIVSKRKQELGRAAFARNLKKSPAEEDHVSAKPITRPVLKREESRGIAPPNPPNPPIQIPAVPIRKSLKRKPRKKKVVAAQ